MNFSIEKKKLSVEPNGHRIPTTIRAMVSCLGGESSSVLAIGPTNCRYCGESPHLILVADETARAQDPCPYPNGITTDITINVSSGRIIVTDDLRPVYDCDPEPFVTLSSSLGQARLVEAMASIGCAYGPVRSCAGLYRTGADSYIIASPDYDQDDEPSLPEDTLLAEVATNRWSYSIADFEDWKARGGGPEQLEWTNTVVDVTPGTYRFVHNSEAHGFGGAPGTVVFAQVERIG
jgi:hypothetical protein